MLNGPQGRPAARVCSSAGMGKPWGKSEQQRPANTRMAEKHYSHLSPSLIAETVRQAFGSLGLVEPSNMVPIGAAR